MFLLYYKLQRIVPRFGNVVFKTTICLGKVKVVKYARLVEKDHFSPCNFRMWKRLILITLRLLMFDLNTWNYRVCIYHDECPMAFKYS